MDPIPRFSLFVTFSFLVSMIHPHLTDDSVEVKSEEYLKNIIVEKMVPLIKLLGLDKLETEEERRREMYVNFSTVPVRVLLDERTQAKVMLNLYGHQLRLHDVRKTAETLHPSDRAKYDLKKFNNGIVALGVENFMTAATQFCEEEAAGGAIDIVSIGSGDGTIERALVAEYRSRYGKDLPRIKLVDPDPAFDGIVDFKTVDHLIEESPKMVGNCVAFIIWPLPVSVGLLAEDGPEPYDIEAVRKLQPRAVFAVYECTGGGGSNDFRTFLRDEKLETLPPDEFGIQNWLAKFHHYEKETYGLDNYKIIEIAHQKILLPRSGTYIFRMVKLKRDKAEHDSSDL